MEFKISKNVKYNHIVGWRGDKLIKLNRNYAGRFYLNLKPVGTRYAEREISGLTMEGKRFKIVLPERIEFDIKE